MLTNRLYLTCFISVLVKYPFYFEINCVRKPTRNAHPPSRLGLFWPLRAFVFILWHLTINRFGWGSPYVSFRVIEVRPLPPPQSWIRTKYNINFYVNAIWIGHLLRLDYNLTIKNRLSCVTDYFCIDKIRNGINTGFWTGLPTNRIKILIRGH